MEGLNLAEKRCSQILMHAPETPVEKIKKINELLFEVQSLKSNDKYQINLSTITCNCLDFPIISLCKHIATVVHFFGGVDLGPQPPRNGTSDSVSKSVEHESPGQPVSCIHDHNVLSPQLDLRYNVGGAINNLTQTGTTCALVLLVNVPRPSLQCSKELLSGCLITPKH